MVVPTVAVIPSVTPTLTPEQLLANISDQVYAIGYNNSLFIDKFWPLYSEMTAFNTMIDIMVLFALLFIAFTFIFKRV